MGPVKIQHRDRDVKMPMVKLTYFDLEGRGELIRLLIHAGNIDFEDFFTKLPGLRFAKTQEDRVTKAKEMMEDFLPKWLAPLETLLKKRGGEWYSGSGPTFADLAMMVALDFMHAPEEMAFKDMDNLKERRALLDKFPLVKGNYQRTCQLPSVRSWKAKKPAFHGF